MNYRDKVIQYFDFTTGIELHLGHKHRKAISIAGKPTKRMIAIFLVIVGIMGLAVIDGNVSDIHDSIAKNNLNIKPIANMILPIIATIMVFVKSKLLFKKIESKPNNINIYQRELPSKLKPAHVRMLLNDGLIDGIGVAATLLDLIDNGYLELSKTKNKLDLFSDNNIILKKTNKDYSNLLEYEKFLIKWFIDDCGDGEKITSNALKKSLNESINSNITANYLFEYFQALAIISFPIHKYYSKRDISSKKHIKIALVLITFLHIDNPVALSVLIYVLGTSIFATPKYIFTKEGTEQEDSWRDLKKYLKDFGNIKNKKPEMIILWNYYLTYSVALGINGETSRQIESFFGKEIYNGEIITEKAEIIHNSQSDNELIKNNIEHEKFKYEHIIGLK